MRRHILIIIGILAAMQVTAQARGQNRAADEAENLQPHPLPPSLSPQAGRTADTGIGDVGQRQTREESATNIQPLGRIDSRIGNRVQSRIRNRIDANYDPQSNALSPFRVAGDEVKAAGRDKRR